MRKRSQEVRRMVDAEYMVGGKAYQYEIPERYMGYALLGGRFDTGDYEGDVIRFLGWWHEQAEMERQFNAQKRRSA